MRNNLGHVRWTGLSKVRYGRQCVTFILVLACVIHSISLSTEAAQPYNTYLGQFRTVEARSNSGSSNPANYINHSLYGNVNTGLRWECVEYMRRFYLSALNLHITSLGHGRDWFGLAPDIVYMDSTTRRVGFDRFDDNTVTRPPAAGDILAYNNSVGNGFGHVAIIKRVRPGYILTAQQNWSNESSDLDRRLTLSSEGNRYNVGEAGVQGWLRPRCEARQSNARWHPNGSLLVEPSGAVWFIEYDPVDRRQERRPVPDEWTFVTRGWSWCTLITTTADELAAYPVGDVVGNSERVIRRPDGAIFRVNDRGYKQVFASMRVFDGLGYSMSEVEHASSYAAVDQIPDNPAAPRLTAPFPDGTLVRNGLDQTVHIITDGGRRAFSSAEAFQRLGYDFNRVLSIDSNTFNQIDEKGSPINECTVRRDCVVIDPNPVGSVTVNATLNGQPWSGSVDYSIVGPNHVILGYAVPGTTNNLSTGQYTLTFKSGGPDSLVSITPSATQTLSANSTLTFTMNFGSQGGGFDEFAPNLFITSPNHGQTVTSSAITISGTASDAGRGESGITSVTVNGIRANGGTAAGSDTAYWNQTIALSPGANTITVIAMDGSVSPNSSTQSITVYHQPNPTPTPTPTPSTYSINGRVMDNSGNGIADVQIALSGAQAWYTTTTVDGGYTFWNLPAGGSYTITPSHGSHTFNPQTLSFNYLSQDESGNFTATRGLDQNGKIVFTRGINENAEIYAMNVDGSGQINLTNNSWNDEYPAVSPDGMKIAFVSWRDGNKEIYVMDVDGSNQTNITNHYEYDLDPAWSPDGSKIAFHSYRDGNAEIYVMNADGSNPARLTYNDQTIDTEPSWSPDSTKIVFQSFQNYIVDIYVMNADGSNLTRLTDSSSQCSDPSWSPDGSKIAFSRNGKIYLMSPDGGNLTTIVDYPPGGSDPAWSSDGTKIVFCRYADGNAEIYVMNADGSDQNRVTYNSEDDFEPVWQVVSGTIQPPIVKYSVSGQVKVGAAGLGGVTMKLTGGAGFTPRITTTLSTGNYSFSNLPADRTYIVTATKANYTFNPSRRSYVNLSGNKALQNFAAKLKIYIISGQIKFGAAGLGGVTVRLTGGAGFTSRVATTLNDGSYSFANLPAGRSYIVMPTKMNYTFGPMRRSYLNLSGNKTLQNFAAR